MKTHIKQLFKRPSFYIGGTVGLLLFFFALGLGLNGPDATISLIGRRFVEISAFPPKLLLGPISHSFREPYEHRLGLFPLRHTHCLCRSRNSPNEKVVLHTRSSSSSRFRISAETHR